MTPSELSVRVALASAALVVALAVPAAWAGGAAPAVGVLAGGGLTIANFVWLAWGTRALRAGSLGRRGFWMWAVATGARFAALLVAFGTLLASGWAHPVAVIAGLTVLPAMLIVHGWDTAHRL